ncbi:MAG TPA: hypothetical protein VIC85_11790, partial [Ktedonobacterales bacterium]
MTRSTRSASATRDGKPTATESSAPARSNGRRPADVSGHDAPPSAEHAILLGLRAVRDGDFSVRLPSDWTDLEGKIADTFNDIVAANQTMANELKRVGHVVGKEGKTRE